MNEERHSDSMKHKFAYHNKGKLFPVLWVPSREGMEFISYLTKKYHG